MDKRLIDAKFIRKCAAIQQARNEAYKTQCDPLFFMVQAGELPLSAWQSARQGIKESLPYPDGWKDDPTPEELAAQARAQRDSLLASTDWTQLPDVPQATREAYAVYRQALRDVPLQDGFPTDIIWPTLGD
jgi:hypothetical protein